MMKKYILIFLLPIIYPIYAQAVTCDGSGDSTDIANEISAASPGDTIMIDAGTCTLTSTVTLNKNITLQGAGPGQTIMNNYGFIMEGQNNDNLIRITGFTWNYTGTNYIQMAENNVCLTNMRLDNNIIKGATWPGHSGSCVYGVIDNNYFTNHDRMFLFLGDQDYSWARDIEPGSVNSLFIENNTFYYSETYSGTNEVWYHQNGARTVIRFNTVDAKDATGVSFATFDTHGNWGNCSDLYVYRGQPLIEFYMNKVQIHNGAGYFMNIRGGSMLVYGNEFTTISGTPSLAKLTDEETWSGTSGPWCTAQLNYCCPQDQVWPAGDQVNNQFWWDNTINGNPVEPADQDAYVIQEDRDYFNHAPQSSGGKEILGANNMTDVMTFSSSGANAYYPYTAYDCPHPLTGLSGSCDYNIAGTDGYNVGDTTAPTIIRGVTLSGAVLN